MPNFTTEDLLVYIYNEMEPEESAKLEVALHTDWALQQKYSVLNEAKTLLDETQLHSPRAKTVNTILKYAGSKLHYSN